MVLKYDIVLDLGRTGTRQYVPVCLSWRTNYLLAPPSTANGLLR